MIVLGIGTKQERIPFLATAWCPHPCIFRIAHRYLLYSLIFPHSLHIFKDFGTQINTTVFMKIFIFQKWVLFPIWFVSWSLDCWIRVNPLLLHTLTLSYMDHLFIVYSINVKYWHQVMGSNWAVCITKNITVMPQVSISYINVVNKNKWSMCENVRVCDNRQYWTFLCLWTLVRLADFLFLDCSSSFSFC